MQRNNSDAAQIKLLNAIKDNDLDAFKSALEDIDRLDFIDEEDGDAPFVLAAKNSNLEMMRLMYEKDSTVIRSKSGYGCSALHEAAIAGNLKLVEYLLDRGADSNLYDKFEQTPFNISLRTNLDIAKRIARDNPAILFEVSPQGRWTALHYACNNFTPLKNKSFDLDTIAWLVRNGIDIQAKDNDDLAVFADLLAELQWLPSNLTPENLQVVNNKVEILRIFLCNGAGINQDLTKLPKILEELKGRGIEVNLDNAILIGAQIENDQIETNPAKAVNQIGVDVPMKARLIPNAIYNNHDLHKALKKNKPLNIPVLDKAINRLLMKNTKEIEKLENAKKAIKPMDPEASSQVFEDIEIDIQVLKANSTELEATKRILSPNNNLKATCLFFIAQHEHQEQFDFDSIPIDLQEELEIVRDAIQAKPNKKS